LHLNSLSAIQAGPIISTKSAPGLLIATGNEGHSLKKEEINTYISHDGGLSWRLAAKGNHRYEVADQGGLIVMAPSGEPINNVFFSWDSGYTFTSVEVSKHKFYVTNIRTDKQKLGVFFVVEGVLDGSGGFGVLIPIDFSFLMPKICDSKMLTDFEEWIPKLPDDE
jgi:hypothetical protein